MNEEVRFHVPVGALVVPTDASTAAHLVASHPELLLHDQRQLDARLRTRMTTVFASAHPVLSGVVADRAYRLDVPVVAVGPDTDESVVVRQRAHLRVPAGARLVMLDDDDLSAVDDVVVVGDVHNCHRTLDVFLDRLGVNDAQDGMSPLVVLVGDLVDKGGEGPADAVRTLERVMELVKRGLVVVVRGNHDHMLLRRLVGKSAPTEYTRETLDAVRNHERCAEITRFLANMPLALRLADDVVVAHADYSAHLHSRRNHRARHHFEQVCCFGARPRDVFEGTIIHGHHQVKEPTVTVDDPTRRINVDTAACEGGELTGYRVGADPSASDAFVAVPCEPADVSATLERCTTVV